VAPAPSSVAVECRGLVKRFHHYEHRTTTLQELFVRAVRRQPIHVRRAHFQITDVNLCIARGESGALIGANGGGEITLLRLIAGIYPPTEGRVVTHGSVVGVIELGATFHGELTGEENVRLYAAALGLSRRRIERQFQLMVDFADIGDFIAMPLKYYSTGMRARLAFSVAICTDPDILLLDEVLAVGDASFRHKCLARLAAHHERAGTLVVVSHDLTTIEEICSRAVWLERGTVRLAGPVGSVVSAYREVYGAD
jgi:ABC-type polysaccharide/polyol phosphate transport system ATPase subunit